MKKEWKNCIISLATLLFCVGVYVLAWAVTGNELVLPKFSNCIKSAWDLLKESWFWLAFYQTVLRVFCAFSISAVLALGFAVVSYLLPTFARICAPIIAFFRAVPTLAVLLIILVWTSASVAPIIVAFLTLFPALYASFYASLLGVDERLIEMSRVYKVPVNKRVFALYLPSVAPQAIRESVACLGLGLKLVASAEVLAGTYLSLGGLMQDAKAYLDLPLLFALVFVCVALSLVLEWLGNRIAVAVERRIR